MHIVNLQAHFVIIRPFKVQKSCTRMFSDIYVDSSQVQSKLVHCRKNQNYLYKNVTQKVKEELWLSAH